ncbi:MAG: hypothetical protein DHS20C18_17700 [Saprospiraceae bacterium]|nr:MAG: hypothetical protein DHS20C18_17700 [Saprospiraceae bacterium]
MGLMVLSCNKDSFQEAAVSKQTNDPQPQAEIDQFVLDQLEANGVFKWEIADDHMIWSAGMHSDQVMAIGYQPAGETNLKEKIHEVDLKTQAWTEARKKVIDFIVESSQSNHPDAHYKIDDLLFTRSNFPLPFFHIKVVDEGLISALRKMPEVRYVEPASYTMNEGTNDRSDAGCGISQDNSIPSADYTTVSPNAKVPWNFYQMNIPQAWNTSKGQGIKICIIDTGTSANQSKLGSQFSSGESTGRSIERIGTFVPGIWPWSNADGPNDDCGHGTQMTGLATAPKTSAGSSVGVAYKSSLLAIRGTDDVWLNWWREKEGVADGLYIAGNRSDVKIISMSLGDIFWSSTVADGVYYAYNKGKMVFAAAGTSTWFTSWVGVTFPGTMSETVTITGIKDGSSMQKCSTCHSGSAVDFVAVMQRASDNERTSLTLYLNGNTPARVGGSSAATATTAGIAALVWATNPGQTRAQVLQRMKNASSNYPSRNSEFGWGLIDAAAAVN